MRWLLVVLVLGLGGCASYKDLGGGRYERVASVQDPSAFGVSNAFAKVENCEGRPSPYYPWKVAFSDCRDVTKYEHGYAQGWAPDVLQGLATGLGFGIGGALSRTSTTITGSSATSSSTSTGTAAFPPGLHK